MIGETVGDYVRKRRISESAMELLATKQSIFNIALNYQFESQQAYARSFQSVFNVSPGRYRKRGHKYVAFDRYMLSPTDLNHLENNFIMEPKILTVTEKKLIGMQVKTSHSDNKIPELWQRFMPRRNEIKNNKNTGYYSVRIAFLLKNKAPILYCKEFVFVIIMRKTIFNN